MGEWLPGTKIGCSFEECYEVFACTNGKREKVLVFGVATAAEQGRTYMKGGHNEFSVRSVWLLVDGDGQYVFEDNGGMTIGTVHRKVIPSQYLRADFYPGITVSEYDRVVLKRGRVSIGQVVCMAIISLMIMVAPIFLLAEMSTYALGKAGPLKALVAVIIGCVLFLVVCTCLNPWVMFCVRLAQKLTGIPPEKR